MIKKTEVYECPNGVFEKTKERAIARHLVDLINANRDNETLTFSAALELIKKARQVVALLEQVFEEI